MALPSLDKSVKNKYNKEHQVMVRMDNEMVTQLQDYCNKNGVNYSIAIRTAISQMLRTI